eukprot:7231653-Prorocentrum_lima.AAC.1
MVGLVKEHMRKVLHVADVGPSYGPCAAMYVADVMRHNSIGVLWTQPACGELVAAVSYTHLRAHETRRHL